MYVKEDLIMPHGVTFYELILTKARGKSGPLFHFDVHDDVRVGAIDHRVEKDESHAGKGAQCEIQMWHHAHTHTHTHTHARTHARTSACVLTVACAVMEKRVYERNKDRFPYSRFEVYDPSIKWDEYTTHGHETRGEGINTALL